MEWQTTTTLLSNLHDPTDQTAWRRLAERFHPLIAGFARRSGLPANECEDTAQEVLTAFFEAFRRGEYDATKGRLSQWLFGFTRIHMLRAREKLARKHAHEVSSPGTTFWSQQAADDTAADRHWEESLWQTCAELARGEFQPTTYRAFELVVRDGLSAAQAAELLGVNVKAVYNAKHRVLERIRRMRDDLDGC